MSKKTLITKSDKVLGGVPVFAGTRVPVHNLIDYLEEGENLDAFLNDFPSVSREQATGVLEIMKKDLLGKSYESAA